MKKILMLLMGIVLVLSLFVASCQKQKTVQEEESVTAPAEEEGEAGGY